MTRTMIALLLTAPLLAMGSLHAVAAHLDRATRDQCARQDWPASQHAAHAEFCRTYLASR